METYQTWMRLFELQRYYSWIVDRFHISTQACQLQTHGKRYDFRWLEERMVPLGFRLIHLCRMPESFASARTERLKVSGNPAQYDDLSKLINEQNLMNELVDQSILPTCHVDVSDNNIPQAVDRIVSWLKSTGGLYYPSH